MSGPVVVAATVGGPAVAGPVAGAVAGPVVVVAGSAGGPAVAGPVAGAVAGPAVIAASAGGSTGSAFIRGRGGFRAGGAGSASEPH